MSKDGSIESKLFATVDSIEALLQPHESISKSSNPLSPCLFEKCETLKEMLVESELKRVLQFHEFQNVLSCKGESEATLKCLNGSTVTLNEATPIIRCNNQGPSNEMGLEKILKKALREKFDLQLQLRHLKVIPGDTNALKEVEIYDSQTLTSEKCRSLKRHHAVSSLRVTKFDCLIKSPSINNRKDLAPDLEKLVESSKTHGWSKLRPEVQEHDRLKMKIEDLYAKLMLEKVHNKRVLTKYKLCRTRAKHQEVWLADLQNQLFDLKGNIRVYCRIRPLADGHNSTCRKVGQDQIEISNSSGKKIEYNFIDVFGQRATQAEVFQSILPLLRGLEAGCNVSLFAYGQTGSGKTYTMEGTIDQPGISYRAIGFVFSELKQAFQSINLGVIEVYNENIYDLLSQNSTRQSLQIKLQNGKAFLPRQRLVSCKTKDQVFSMFRKATHKRTSGSHVLNATSSRSHLVTQLFIQLRDENQSPVTLNLIDLAGSERLYRTNTESQARKETQNINKSLSCLSNVIHSLQNHNNREHFPFRDSKLTFLLQDFMKPRSKGRVGIMINISPEQESLQETKCSLNFGKRCSKVALKC